MSELDSYIHGEDEYPEVEESDVVPMKEISLWEREPKPSPIVPVIDSEGQPFEKFTKFSPTGVFSKQELARLRFVRWELQQQIAKSQIAKGGSTK